MIALPHFGLAGRARTGGMAIRTDMIALPHFGLAGRARTGGLAI
jgi:hypothetical protein